MKTDINLLNCPIGNIRIEKYFNKYNLSIRVGDYCEFDYSKISNQIHYHDCYELVFVLSGKGTFLHKDKSFLLKEGALFISEPECSHEIHIKANDNLVLLYFLIEIHKISNKASITYEEKVIDNFIENHQNAIENEKQLLGYITFFEDYIQNKGHKTDFWYIRALENFIFNCIDILSVRKVKLEKHENVQSSLIEEALDYIDQNLSIKISADDIAEYINTSKRNLYLLFSKHLNKTVHNYINERKIYLAEYYLKTNISISEVGCLVGIDNLSQFSKLFKHYMKVSPSEYKRKNSAKGIGYGRRYSVEVDSKI